MVQVILVAFWLLFLIGWFVIYFCAVRQKNDGVAWITHYTGQVSSFFTLQQELTHYDGYGLVASILIPGLGWYFVGNNSLLLCAVPALVGSGLYFLGRQLGGTPMLSVLSAAGVAVCFELHPAAGALSWAICIFYRWISLPDGTALWRDIVCLGGSTLLLACAAFDAPLIWWILPVAILFWVLVLVQRWRAGLSYTGARLLRDIVIGLVLLSAILLGYFVCFGVADGLLEWSECLTALQDGRFALLLELVWREMGNIFRYAMEYRQALAGDWPIVLAGFLAWLAVLVQLLWQHSAAAGFLVCLTLPLFVLPGGCYVLPLGLLANVAFAATGMWNRGKKTWAVLLPSMMLLLEIINQFLE